MRGTITEGVSLGCGLAGGCCVFVLLAVLGLVMLASMGAVMGTMDDASYEQRGRDAVSVP